MTLSVLAIAILVPSASAQVGVFGTQVRVGDSDYIPVTKAASFAVKANELDLENPRIANDDCILLDTGKTPAAGAQFKDLRLTPCLGRAAGSLIANDADVEVTAPYPQVPAANVQYADVNSNGKYDKGDYVYITTNATAGIARTGTTGNWTVRLTPSYDRAAGTFVRNGDPDMNLNAGAIATLAASVVEREDSQWYLIPAAAGYAKGSPIPANSIRLGGPAADTSDVRPMRVQVLTDPIQAGKPVTCEVEVQNQGKAFGSGLLSARLGGILASVQFTPLLNPGDKATILLNFPAPDLNGTTVLEVNDIFQVVSVQGSDNLGQAESALLQRISALEAEVADLRSFLSETSEADSAIHPQQAGAAANAPNATLPLVLFAVFVVVAAMKRKTI